MVYAWLISLVAALFIGWEGHSWKTAAERLKQTQEFEAYKKRAEEVAHNASGKHEETKKEIEVRYVTRTKEITKYIDRPVYLQQCVDDDGLRAINSEITRAANPSQP